MEVAYDDETYMHRVGRAGRFGSLPLLFFSFLCSTFPSLVVCVLVCMCVDFCQHTLTSRVWRYMCGGGEILGIPQCNEIPSFLCEKI